jgi:ketosteroid isomerase-like protein
MKPRLLTIGVLAGALAIPAWAQSSESELLQIDREWAKAAASDDLQTVFSFWADDAEIYAPGRPPAVGIEEIREFVEKRRATPGSSISWEPLVAGVSASGDLGYTRGTYEMTLPTPSGDPVQVQGTYVSLWRRDQTGKWKCILEIHSPLPSPEPTKRP